MFFRMVYKSGQIFPPFCHNTRVWQTDGQTDRILITIPRLHYMQRGKNCRKCDFPVFSVIIWNFIFGGVLTRKAFPSYFLGDRIHRWTVWPVHV